jgi:Helix-turn-helix
MMLVGKIAKEGAFWEVEVEAIGAWTQGRSRKEAMVMLVDVVQTMIDTELKRSGVKVTVTLLGSDGPSSYDVLVKASEPTLLGALVLKYQRTVRGLTLAEVAAKLGTAHHNAYASYEQGRRDPSLGKFSELLAAVAPEMTLTVAPRKPTLRARRKSARREARRRSA